MPEYRNVREQYFDWLSGRVSPELLPELVCILEEAEKYCISNKIILQPFFSMTDVSTVRKNIKAFNSDRDFRNRFRRTLAKINSSLQLYILFLKHNPDIFTQDIIACEEHKSEIKPLLDETSDLPNINDESVRYAHILEEHFKDNGYQLGRAIFRGRFKNYYLSEYGHEPEQTSEQIEALLCKIGKLRDGRVFPISDGEQDNLINEILCEITSSFNNGATTVYPSALFERFREKLGEIGVYTEESLTSLILEISDGKFCQKHSRLVFKGREANPTADIRKILQESPSPMSVEEIHNIAWYIPLEKIKFILTTGSTFVCIGTGTYYYAPNFPISDNEKKTLISAIGSQIDLIGYITDVELMNIISEKCPCLAINSAEFPRGGIRNCLGYIMRGQFAFNGPIITRRGSRINLSEVFRRFAAEHQHFTYDELKAFADEMEATIYWDAVMSETVRLNENEFIRKDELSPDIAAIDDYLDGICTGEYLPLCEINLFLSFPSIGYRWNGFLLESYLNLFSKKFRLIHNCFTKKEACGAMVRANSKISDYNALITDALSKAGKEFTAKTALEYLVGHGYQAKRSCKDIENVLRTVNQNTLLKQN